jgi:hypothetical protein
MAMIAIGKKGSKDMIYGASHILAPARLLLFCKISV